MEYTIENTIETAHVRLYIPKTNHDRAKRITKIVSAKKVLEDHDMTAATIQEIYLDAIEIGLTALEAKHND